MAEPAVSHNQEEGMSTSVRVLWPLSQHGTPALSRNGTRVPGNRALIQSAEYNQQEVPV